MPVAKKKKSSRPRVRGAAKRGARTARKTSASPSGRPRARSIDGRPAVPQIARRVMTRRMAAAIRGPRPASMPSIVSSAMASVKTELLCGSPSACADEVVQRIATAAQMGLSPAEQAQLFFTFASEVAVAYMPRIAPQISLAVRRVRPNVSAEDMASVSQILMSGKNSMEYAWGLAVQRVTEQIDVASAASTDARLADTTLDKNMIGSLEQAAAEPDQAKRLSMFQRIYDRYGPAMKKSLKYAALAALLGTALYACASLWGGLCMTAQKQLIDALGMIQSMGASAWANASGYAASAWANLPDTGLADAAGRGIGVIKGYAGQGADLAKTSAGAVAGAVTDAVGNVYNALPAVSSLPWWTGVANGTTAAT